MDEIIEYWDCGFTRNTELLPPPPASASADSSKSVLALLDGFFEFYANFDFFNYVVCPFLGKPVNRKLFDARRRYQGHQEFTIEGMERYFDNLANNYFDPNYELIVKKPVCLQDPFELNRNVVNIPEDKLTKFQVTAIAPPKIIFLTDH